MYAEERTMRSYWKFVLYIPLGAWIFASTIFCGLNIFAGIPMWATTGMAAFMGVYLVILGVIFGTNLRHQYLTAYHICKNGLCELRKELDDEWNSLGKPYPYLGKKREWLKMLLQIQESCPSEALTQLIEALQDEIQCADQEILRQKSIIWKNALPFREYIPEKYVPEHFLHEPT